MYEWLHIKDIDKEYSYCFVLWDKNKWLEIAYHEHLEKFYLTFDIYEHYERKGESKAKELKYRVLAAVYYEYVTTKLRRCLQI